MLIFTDKRKVPLVRKKCKNIVPWIDELQIILFYVKYFGRLVVSWMHRHCSLVINIQVEHFMIWKKVYWPENDKKTVFLFKGHIETFIWKFYCQLESYLAYNAKIMTLLWNTSKCIKWYIPHLLSFISYISMCIQFIASLMIFDNNLHLRYEPTYFIVRGT